MIRLAVDIIYMNKGDQLPTNIRFQWISLVDQSPI